MSNSGPGSSKSELTLSRVLVSAYEGNVVLVVVDPTRMTPEAFVVGHDDAVRMHAELGGSLAEAASHYRDGRPTP